MNQGSLQTFQRTWLQESPKYANEGQTKGGHIFGVENLKMGGKNEEGNKAFMQKNE